MRTCAFVLLAMSVFVSTATAATITVKRDGTGDVPSVAMALGAISNGDTIVIGDSATYEEDLTAGAVAGLAASFTLRAAEGQTPTICAANGMARLDPLGLPGTDYLGAVFFGCQGVLIEGITFENQTTSVNMAGVSSILALIDCSNITVRNCTVRGAGGMGTDYPAQNQSIIVIGMQTAPVNVLIEDCLIEETNFGPLISKAQPNAPTDPSVTIRGCTVRNCEETGIQVVNGAYPESIGPMAAQGPGNLIENNTIINCDGGIQLGGGYNVVRNCTVLASTADGLHVSVDGTLGTRPVIGIVENSAFVGGKEQGVEIENGQVSLTGCIVAGNHEEGLWLHDSGIETTVTVDHCDFYHNALTAASPYEVRVDVGTGEPMALIMTNSNVVGRRGLYNGSINDPADFDADALTARYCNVFVDAEPFTNVISENNQQVDPKFVNPTVDVETFTRDGFKLAEDSPVRTAGEGGTPIGSQGSPQTPVIEWSIY